MNDCTIIIINTIFRADLVSIWVHNLSHLISQVSREFQVLRKLVLTSMFQHTLATHLNKHFAEIKEPSVTFPEGHVMTRHFVFLQTLDDNLLQHVLK